MTTPNKTVQNQSSSSSKNKLDADNSSKQNSKTSTQSSSTATSSSSTSKIASSTQPQQNSQNDNVSQAIIKQQLKNLSNKDDSKDKENAETNESKTNLIINYIPPTMNEAQLATLFSPYGTIENCKIVFDLNTNRSRGYGFVQYKNSGSAVRALQALNGFSAQGKKLKVAFARPNCKEIQNANLFITNLPSNYSEQELRKLFQDFGQIVECRILPQEHDENQSRGVGFVRMDTHLNAINALQARDNHVIDPKLPPITVKLAQRYIPNRILQQQNYPHFQYETRNKNYAYNMGRGGGNTGNYRQSSNRRYTRQPNQQMNDINNNYNFFNHNPYDYNYNTFYNYHDNMDNQHNPYYRPFNYDRQYNDSDDQLQHGNYPMYFDVNPYHPIPTQQFASMSMDVKTTTSNNDNNNTIQSKITHTNASNRGQSSSATTSSASAFNIIVNHLPSYYNVDHLIQMYAPYGPIQSVNIQKPTSSKQSTSGIISFFYFDDAQRAQSETNGRRLENNQRLEVVFQAK